MPPLPKHVEAVPTSSEPAPISTSGPNLKMASQSLQCKAPSLPSPVSSLAMVSQSAAPKDQSPIVPGSSVKMASQSSPPKTSTSFARPRIRTPSPTVVAYWTRLSNLLRETQAAVTGLKPMPDVPSTKGWHGAVATNLQGLSAADVAATVKRESAKASEWDDAYVTGGLGGLVTYGVGCNMAGWVSMRLATFGWDSPQLVESFEEGDIASDAAVEAVRVRVFEAEPAYLSVEVAEKVLAVRKKLRRFRNRIELCLRILGGLEGRGRKLAPAALEKAKVLLEKADQMHFKEEEKIKFAEEKEKEKERERERKSKAKEEKRLQRAKDSKKKAKLEKKRKQQSAQATFMRKFVKKAVPFRADDILVGLKDSGIKEDEEIEVMEETTGGVLNVYKNKDVMSIACWLLSDMDPPPFEEMDRSLKPASKSMDPSIPTADGDIGYHLARCAERRKNAESRISRTLLEYRRKRNQRLEDRTPRFTKRRADVRGRIDSMPLKLLQFHEDYRPAFFGINDQKSTSVRPKRPFGKDVELDYSCNSADEWEEEDDGEDILDIEVDKEEANEDDELRKLYGSDDEDDDDFLDDGDAEDEDGDDSDRGDMEVDDASKILGGNVKLSSESPAGSQGCVGQPPAVADLNGSPEGEGQRSEANLIHSIAGSGKKKVRGPKANAEGPKRKKRRRNSFEKSVVIQGVSFPTLGVPSPLDIHPVKALEGAPRITVFNPYITHVSHFLQEKSPPKPVPIRIPRTSLDERTKLDLAVALMTTNERTSRDAIVYQFCERRRSLGLPLPPKIEIVRAIRVIAANEKRKGDSRAGWYLKDEGLAAKVRAMNLHQPRIPPVVAPVVRQTMAAPISTASQGMSIADRIRIASAVAEAKAFAAEACSLPQISAGQTTGPVPSTPLGEVAEPQYVQQQTVAGIYAGAEPIVPQVVTPRRVVKSAEEVGTASEVTVTKRLPSVAVPVAPVSVVPIVTPVTAKLRPEMRNMVEGCSSASME